MASRKIMQGDAYAVPFEITLNETTSIVPGMVSEIEVCIGDDDSASIRKTYTSGNVWYDNNTEAWYFRFAQSETFDLEPGSYNAIARVKFSGDEDADVIGVKIGNIIVNGTCSEVVI